MPHSAEEGRPWMTERLRALDPTSMLDVGTGAGTYADLFAREFPRAHRTGIEVWEPYVEQFDLQSKYDVLWIHDVRDYLEGPDELTLPVADVVILGDVLEHMELDDAVGVWRKARQAARQAVYLSIPIIHYPQDALEGNPHEVHVVDDYTHERVLATFPGITAHWTGTIIGVYEAAA